MDIGTAMSVAQTLFAALQCSQLQEICSIAGYKSKLVELRATVVRIKAVLKDAEAKQVLSEQEQLYIEELKDAVYEADDLFDEFVTLAERKQLTKGVKVRVLSLFTKFGTAYSMTQGVKKIKRKLDAIAYNSQFSLNIDPKPIKDRRPETCSYVYEADIIGREPDLEKIVGVLLHSNVQQNISFLSIVGIGGLGKTALAQLVYNDVRVTTVFPLRLWTCVADENQELLDVQGVLCKILASATGQMKNEGCTMDGLQIQLREQLAGKKYLLVLDDVWTENYERWHTLTKYLMGGQRGSWVVVTTRSWETARIIGDGPRHDLQGLSTEKSWCLFKRVAFGSHQSPEDLVDIGQDIVEKCANVPLAIRVVGSLLYGQDKHKWHTIQKMGLVKVNQSQNSIMSILKLSYYQLESSLKSCFGYCTMFPKDFVIQKDTLIRLWMAQGYIPLDDTQSQEDLGEEYFSILLQRCFFQDVKKDEDDNIRSCKIHDLMHDVAQEVMGNEICTVKTINGDANKKVRHLSVICSKSSNFSFTNKSHIRSYLHANDSYQDMVRMDKVCVDSLLANWKYLRVIGVSRLDIKSLPGSIGELIHLRYLDLSFTELEVLPGSITKLYNLETLILKGCENLKELPKDLSKLVKLRVLDLQNCYELRYMPRGLAKLTCLYTLSMFVVGETNSSKKDLLDGLDDLKALRDLRGFIEIRIRFSKTSATSYKMNGGRRGGGCLQSKDHLNCVKFDFDDDEEEEREEYDEAMMELLQPYPNVKRLELWGYHGVKMPHWARENNLATFLPNLVEIRLYHCWKLQDLGKLWHPRLKVLHVINCSNLTTTLQCPSLEDLKSGASTSSCYDIGLKLREVRLDNVALLNLLPTNPFQCGAELVIQGDHKAESLKEASEMFRSCSSSLQYLKIHNCSSLKSILYGGLEHLSVLEELKIYKCPNLSLSEEEREYPFCHSLRSLMLIDLPQQLELPNWIQYLTALQTLHIRDFRGLESVPNWVSKLTSLRELRFIWCSACLEERCQQTGEDWPLIQHIPSVVFTACS